MSKAPPSLGSASATHATPQTSSDRRLQMEDIARLAGVSTSTVSRALNGSPLVNEETRLRISELARSLNYSINISARNLRLQRNRTVAVVVPYEVSTRQHISDPFFVSMLGGLADALTERGYDMLLSRVEAEHLGDAADLAASGRAIGVILIGQWHQHEQLNDMARRQIPLVVWGARLPNQLYCSVGGDNVSGGKLATDHLLDSGRRRIAFLGDPGLPEVAHRFEGYRRALEQHGIAYDAALLRPTAFTEDSARVAIEDLLSRKVRFDGLFCCSDLMAMRAISALREHGVRVPEDVGVVGYDDIELSQYFHPALTTIRQNIMRGAQTLVGDLLAIIEGRQPRSDVMEAQLVVRESSRKPAAG